MIEHVAVVVPAADEQQRIAACLSSVLAACAEVDTATRTSVVVVLDRCTDDTAQIVSGFAGVVAITTTARQVGAARAAGAAAIAGGGGDPARVWIANTDADSTVPANWLTSMLASAACGAHLVVGTVLPDDQLAERRREIWTQLHPSRDGHRHVHGANLGIRADVLAAVGGWSLIATGEDVDLVARVARAGFTVHRAAGAPVTTSSRLVGRAPKGFAGYLHDMPGA